MIIKRIALPLYFLFLTLCLQAQDVFEFTTLDNRVKHDLQLVSEVILASLNKPLTLETEKDWQRAFWAMELMLYKTSVTKAKLRQAWLQWPRQTEGFQKALLEVSYTLYPNEFEQEVKTVLETTSSGAIFVRCSEYLLNATNSAQNKKYLLSLVEKRLNKNTDPAISILHFRLLSRKSQTLPPLQDLFSKEFLRGETVVYSLQRSNRNFAGLVIIRKPDGSFVWERNGKLFTSAQLARAITGYPFYITNGNTPQGIFRWTGFDTSSIAYIGPTPNLQLVMPHESSTALFFRDSSLPQQWSKDLYASLLPTSWKKYKPIYESYFAGAVGRSEIIMHGTTIDPAYYKSQPYYPQTPSLGCLCSYEEWDKDGKRTLSNQQRIVDALRDVGSKKGYVVVVDINDKKSNVSVEEVLAAISAATPHPK